MNNYTIILKKIKKKFNDFYALNDIGLNIQKGTCFGLVGPNGAGKSTLIDSICGILELNSGKIYILGEEMNPDNIRIKKKIGVMTQELALLDYFNSIEYLSYIANLYSVNKRLMDNHIISLLKVLGLYNERRKMLVELSTGMRKKVAFIAAMLHLPEVLILDEPFENVDPTSRKKMKEILQRIRKNGTTVFITSHLLQEVEDFCDEVAIINNGRIVYQSATKDIRNKIKNKITQETYQSLEEIFIDLTTDNKEENKIPSWI